MKYLAFLKEKIFLKKLEIKCLDISQIFPHFVPNNLVSAQLYQINLLLRADS